MPTPMHAYAEAASRFGKVDPEDAEAVEEFFALKFAKLPPRTQKAVVDYLMRHEGTASVANPKKRKPKGLPLPNLTTVVLPTLPNATAAFRKPRTEVFTSANLARSYEPVARGPRRSP